MNLEMPSPEQTESLRTLLLIVLGVMIVTIPVACLLVIAKVKAQQRQRPVPGKEGRSASHDTGGIDPVLVAGRFSGRRVGRHQPGRGEGRLS
jgi:heme/copper-type cytochrome/quinol oxidase subunit 2